MTKPEVTARFARKTISAKNSICGRTSLLMALLSQQEADRVLDNLDLHPDAKRSISEDKYFIIDWTCDNHRRDTRRYMCRLKVIHVMQPHASTH